MEKFIPSISHKPVDHDPFASRRIVATVPTTEAQREIWTATSMSAEASCSYNESVSLRLKGKLDRKALSNALQDLVAAHESLRSSLSSDGTRLIIYSDNEFGYFVHDWKGQGTSERVKLIDNLSDTLMTTAFDLKSGPLFRADLILEEEEQAQLRLTAHHVICDGWSLGIMMADIASFYNAHLLGKEIDDSHVIPFRQYVQETITFNKTPTSVEVKQFWLDLYANKIPRVDLPTDRKRPPLKSYAGERIDMEMDKALVRTLREVSTRNGSSLVTTLLTCFELLIHKITQQHDIVVGLPAAGQSDMDMRNVVGHCVNLLPLRVQIDSNASFVEHLKKRRTAVLDAYDNQRFTFGSLINELRVPREAGRIPLVPVVFNVDMNMDDGVSFEGIQHTFISEPRKFENFELFLNATGSEEKLVLEWSYNVSLFDHTTIQDWMSQLTEIIRSVAQNPHIPIRDIGDQIIELSPTIAARKDWEGSYELISSNITIDAIFSDKAKNAPNSVALIAGESALSYAELEQRAEAIFEELKKQGVQVGDPVGISLERSFDMIASMLAILKAGACFVPFDPSYPKERLTFMLEDTAVSILVLSDKTRPFLPAHKAAEIVVEDISQAHRTISDAPKHGVHDAAYIMYTSGSTGTPKGVVIPHRAVIRLVKDQDFLPFSEELVFLQLSNTSFDASTLEIWGALLNGAQLVLQPQQKPTLNEIVDTIQKNAVTTVWFTTGLFNLLVDEQLNNLESLKHIFSGGDVLSVPHITKAFDQLGPGVLHNGYGPTENTTFTCTYQINDLRDIEHGIPIGCPIAGTNILVLNEIGERAKVGEEGILYTGGNGLALGYWRRPALTDEKFIDDPFRPGEKIYNTGDLVKWLPDGNLHFIGRSDSQVKVRGFRIELGEIEKALDDLSSIKDRVVICRTDRPNEKELVAYIVPSQFGDENATITDLSDHDALSGQAREHMSSKLPAHMIPMAFVVMEELPLTANGKVNKRVLPPPTRKTNAMKAQYVAPRDNLEQIIAGIWSDLLDVDRVGVRDNFFELGGHSLIGIQLFAAIKNQLGKELPLKTLFAAHTVAAQARMIKDQGWSNSWQNLSAIQPEGSKTPFFAVHVDEANYFIPKAWGTDQPFYAFFHQGEDGHRILHTEVKDIARHFIQELRQVRPHGPYLLGGYSFGGIIAFEMAQQLSAIGESVPLLALFDTYDPVQYIKVMKQESKFYDVIKKPIMRAIASYFLKRNKPIPGKLRHFYIIDTYDEAIRKYEPRSYKGSITVLKTKSSAGEDHLGWKSWSDQVDVKLLPGNHYSIVKEPHVYDLAKALYSSIEKVVKNVGTEAV